MKWFLADQLFVTFVSPILRWPPVHQLEAAQVQFFKYNKSVKNYNYFSPALYIFWECNYFAAAALWNDKCLKTNTHWGFLFFDKLRSQLYVCMCARSKCKSKVVIMASFTSKGLQFKFNQQVDIWIESWAYIITIR